MTTTIDDIATAGAGLFGRETAGSTSAIAVPLLGVDVSGRVDGAAALMTMRQRYRNDSAHPIEAVYVFPLPDGAAVCGLSAEVDGRRVEGRVMARDDAFATYDDALADGHGAFLLDAERPDIFTLSVGNLKSGAEAVVELRWVVRLHAEGPAFRFVLPTTVSPRYVPADAPPDIGQADGDRVNPPKALHVPYGLTFTLEIGPGFGRLRRLESPTHALALTLGDAPRVSLSQARAAMDRDLVILLEPEARAPSAHVATGPGGDRFVQVAFLPELPAAADVPGDFVFVLDCSGSMGGSSIAEAVRALELCVRTLREGDTFDLVRFGSSFDSLFGASVPYTAATFDAALQAIRATDASYGGTELLAPLRAIVQRPAPRPRTVVLLTDGQVSNEADVIALAAAHKASHRVFAFGIGAGVSESLVRGLARVTAGQAEFIAPGERVEPKVLRQFGRMRTPHLADISVDWGGLSVEQAPRLISGVFAGEPITVSARVLGGSATSLTLHAGGHAFTVPVDLERAEPGGPVPLLYARDAIRDLEDGTPRTGSSQRRGRPDADARREEALVALGTRFGLVSSATSYVAVEHRAPADLTLGAPTLVRVPSMLTAGWGERAEAKVYAAGAMPPAPPSPQPAMRKRSMAPRGGAPNPFVAQRALAGAPVPLAAPSVGDAFGGPPGAPPALEPAPEARADTHLDALFDLLAGQGPDGAFDPAVVLAALRRLEPATAGPAWVSLSSAEQRRAATERALDLLTASFAAEEPLWSEAARKARRWLAAA